MSTRSGGSTKGSRREDLEHGTEMLAKSKRRDQVMLGADVGARRDMLQWEDPTKNGGGFCADTSGLAISERMKEMIVDGG